MKIAEYITRGSASSQIPAASKWRKLTIEVGSGAGDKPGTEGRRQVCKGETIRTSSIGRNWVFCVLVFKRTYHANIDTIINCINIQYQNLKQKNKTWNYHSQNNRTTNLLTKKLNLIYENVRILWKYHLLILP